MDNRIQKLPHPRNIKRTRTVPHYHIKKDAKFSEWPSTKSLPLFLFPSKLTYHVCRTTKYALRKSLTQRFRKPSPCQA